MIYCFLFFILILILYEISKEPFEDVPTGFIDDIDNINNPTKAGSISIDYDINNKILRPVQSKKEKPITNLNVKGINESRIAEISDDIHFDPNYDKFKDKKIQVVNIYQGGEEKEIIRENKINDKIDPGIYNREEVNVYDTEDPVRSNVDCEGHWQPEIDSACNNRDHNRCSVKYKKYVITQPKVGNGNECENEDGDVEFQYCIDGDDGDRCSLGSCPCNAETGEGCFNNNENIISSHHCGCPQGTRLFSNQCENNICRCENGIRAEGSECLRNNSDQCATCNDGFRLSGVECVSTDCSCPNGGQMSGECAPTGSTHCDSCDDGYMIYYPIIMIQILFLNVVIHVTSIIPPSKVY